MYKVLYNVKTMYVKHICESSLSTVSNLLYLLPLPFPFFEVDVDGCDACSLELCLPWRVLSFEIVVPTYSSRESLVGNSDRIGVPSSFFSCTRIRPRNTGSLLRSFGCSLFSTPTLRPAASKTSRISWCVGFSTHLSLANFRPLAKLLLLFRYIG